MVASRIPLGPQLPQVTVPVISLDTMGKGIGTMAMPGRLRIVENHDGQDVNLASLLGRPPALESNIPAGVGHAL